MTETWKPIPMFCPNCGKMNYGYKGIGDKIKYECDRCIIDQDRRFNAQRFEERFYQGNTPEADSIPPMPKFESSTELPEAVPIESDKKDETATDTQADTELITKLLSNPETTALLKALASKL